MPRQLWKVGPPLLPAGEQPHVVHIEAFSRGGSAQEGGRRGRQALDSPQLGSPGVCKTWDACPCAGRAGRTCVHHKWKGTLPFSWPPWLPQWLAEQVGASLATGGDALTTGGEAPCWLGPLSAVMLVAKPPQRPRGWAACPCAGRATTSLAHHRWGCRRHPGWPPCCCGAGLLVPLQVPMPAAPAPGHPRPPPSVVHTSCSCGCSCGCWAAASGPLPPAAAGLAPSAGWPVLAALSSACGDTAPAGAVAGGASPQVLPSAPPEGCSG